MNIIGRTVKEIEYTFQSLWSLEQAGRFWDQVVDYEDINEMTYSYFRRFIDGYNLSSIPDQSYVLDFCCRPGNGTIYFHEKGKVRKAVCADVSERMLQICREKIKKRKIEFSTILIKDYQFPINDYEFDAVLCFETVEHIAEPHLILKEFNRLLKEKGQLLLTTPNILWAPVHWIAAIFNYHHSEGPRRFLSRKKLVKIIKEAGFRIVKEKTTVLIPGGPKFLIKIGEGIEKGIGEMGMRLLGLRRIFICVKD